MKKAFITGITGQDGSYLTELLLNKGYEVHGMIRRSSSNNTQRINHLLKNIHIHYGDLTDSQAIGRLLQQIAPTEIYNLGAQSHVQVSFELPEFTAQVDALGILRILESVRLLGLTDNCKIYQASTSELFGMVQQIPQTELTPFYPRSPYGVAKLYAYWIVKNYRESYNMHASSGILFNHESPRRGDSFVTSKIVKALANIKTGKLDCLYLGNLNSLRDWGHARDYINAMWLMLQQNTPQDYVIATGEQHSVKQFIELAAEYLGMNIAWQGQGMEEQGVDTVTNKVIVKIDPQYFRPSEVDTLLGDATKARTVLGWNPSYSFQELVWEMCEHAVKESQHQQ